MKKLFFAEGAIFAARFLSAYAYTNKYRAVFLVFLFILFGSSLYSRAQKPLIIQGTLNDVQNNNIATDGLYDLRFELYESQERGSPVWMEIHRNVLVVNGLFNVRLGMQTPIDSGLLSRPLFLQIYHLSEMAAFNPGAMGQDSVIRVKSPVRLRASAVRTPLGKPPERDSREHNADSGHGVHDEDRLIITPGGYIESYYSFNFNRPANNVTALRGFDFVNNSITIGNFVISTDAKYKSFSARLALNVGGNPSQFYEQEPATTPSYQVPVMDRHTWQFIQEAVLSWDVKWVRGLTIQGGVMATPIGIEGLPNYQSWRGSLSSPHMHPKDYRENWNWSRSNSFINVPDYHSGIRVLYSLNKKHHFGAFLINGQNAVTDNNDGKTISLSYLWMPSPRFHMSALYMGGPERDRGAPEGQGWRHLIDYCVRWDATKNLSFMTQFTPGVEQTTFGLNKWLINVIYASWRFNNDVRIAFRYEHLLEKTAHGSSTVFLRSKDENNKAGLFGYTATLSVPIVRRHLMARLEYRHDSSRLNWFYKGALQESGNPHEPYIPNARSQNTITLGLVGWF